ncbi:MAG: efflux RND transporter periplasmic adaptor subunit [Candidatus Marinimicrobia bacterium]|nr:efflux RND transporter periplasmic adaptor subunit [Candidatus Neomarinimicrobiota bacterium]
MKKTILLLSTAMLFLLSCGGSGKQWESSEISYIQTVDDIRELTGNLPDPMNDNEARRYLSKIQKLMIPLESDKVKNDLRVVPVNVRTAEREYIAERVRYLGDIKGDPSIAVYPKLSDIITDIYVQNGDHVQKGDILARIDDAGVRDSKKQAEAGYRSAKSQLENVRSEYERTKALHEDNAISQSQWEQVVTQLEVAKAGLSQAEAVLEMAKTQLSHAILRAPANGYVSGRAYDPGDMATPQKPFASIHDIENVKIAINVTERDLGNIEEGQRAEITVGAYPEEIFEGRISVISPVIDPMTRTANIEIISENKNLRLKPGMFAHV